MTVLDKKFFLISKNGNKSISDFYHFSIHSNTVLLFNWRGGIVGLIETKKGIFHDFKDKKEKTIDSGFQIVDKNGNIVYDSEGDNNG